MAGAGVLESLLEVLFLVGSRNDTFCGAERKGKWVWCILELVRLLGVSRGFEGYGGAG